MQHLDLHTPILPRNSRRLATPHLLDQHALGQARSRGTVLGDVRFDRLSLRFPFVATLPQSATEAAIAVGAPAPERGVRVVTVRPRVDRVEVVADVAGTRRELTASAVIVATGSGGRHLAFRPEGVRVRAYGDSYLMADVPAAGEETCALVHLDPDGVLESFPLPGGVRRFVAWDARTSDGAGYSDTESAPRAERLRAAIRRRAQDPDAADAVRSATAFTVRRAVAPRLRRGRLVVIGDAAHEVSPIGGQGMNLGLLDAVTLAPLIAAGVRGALPERALMDWERRRVASARIAARLATANTLLGRPRGRGGDLARGALVRTMLAPPFGGAFARAYAMGFDRDA